MLRRKLLTVGGTCLALLGAPTSPMHAQQADCGLDCSACGVSKFEGRNWDPWGSYNMNCGFTTTYCESCPFVVNDSKPDAEELVKTLVTLPTSNLRIVVEKYRNRLLLDWTRGLLVVLGNQCDEQSLEAVVFLPPDKSHELLRLGVRSLDAFLA